MQYLTQQVQLLQDTRKVNKMGFSSGLTSVTGNVTSVATTRTTSFITGSASSTTTTLGTVGAGKRWVLISLSVSANASSAVTATSTLLLNDVAKLTAICVSNANAAPVSNERIDLTYETGTILTAGQTVKVTGATSLAGATVVYVEESV